MSSHSRPLPTSMRCLDMTSPAQLISFEQPFEMIPPPLCDPEHGADLSPPRQGRSATLVGDPCDLVEVAANRRELHHRLLERQVFRLRYRRDTPKVRSDEERDVGRRSHPPRARSLLEQPPILRRQAHVEPRVAAGFVWRRRHRDVALGRGPKHNVEELLDESRLGDPLAFSQRAHKRDVLGPAPTIAASRRHSLAGERPMTLAPPTRGTT